jgi:hypothetical protein
MSEHIVAKHTRKIFKVWGSPNQNIRHKIGEVLIEIGIIVFAITLSLYLERWREHQHEREIEKQFLLGLKADLGNDIKQQAGDSLTYVQLISSWRYLRVAGQENRNLPGDSILPRQDFLFTKIVFIPNDSRFEALKSSGELGVLGDPALQNKILDLYQYKIRVLLSASESFTALQSNQLIPFLLEILKFQPNGFSNLNEVLQMPRMQNYLLFANYAQQIINRYHDVMEQSRDIIAAIDRQYPDK